MTRHFAHEVHPMHWHQLIPEEQDVEAGNQHVIGVVALQQFGVIRPAERCEGPKRRGEPSVKDVFVACEGDAGTGFGLRFLFGFGDEDATVRSEEHTSELQSLMRISYAVFCLKTKTRTN